MDNFFCLDCGNTFLETNYKMTMATGQVIFRDMNSNQLKCPECKSVKLESIEKEGGGIPSYGRFNSLDDKGKKQVLRKRAREHITKTDKERKEHLDRKFAGKLSHGDF